MNNKESRAGEIILTVISVILIFWGVMILIGDENGLPTILCIGFSTVIFGAFGKRIGLSKGIGGGFYYGWFLSIIGVLIVLAMSSEENTGNKEKTNNANIDKYDEIKKIMELKESGALTEEEFNEEKKKILNN